ncbi:anti-repressor SinI family protein [Peribacillus sp. NPDC046944]|uniref:anti-repressor SinI family protein n=1 Tax=unclassified Peribacillus TaxID=2675266 RepID=UPI003CFC4313
MESRNRLKQEQLDKIWLALIMEAKRIGLTIEQVKKFIEKNSSDEPAQKIR